MTRTAEERRKIAEAVVQRKQAQAQAGAAVIAVEVANAEDRDANTLPSQGLAPE